MTSQDRPPPPGGASAPWLALYHFEGCPYCTKVRRTAARLGVALELRDVRQDPAHRADLIAALGRPRVPVLRIEDADGAAWLPESSAIVDWLREQAGAEPREGHRAEHLLLLVPWVFLAAGLLTEGPPRVVLLLGAAVVLALQALGTGRRP